MNLTKKTLFTLGLLAASVSYAQTPASSTTTGVLGQRYSEFSFEAQDIKFVDPHAYGLNASINAPVVPNALDVGASLGYGWIRGNLRGQIYNLGAYATAYMPLRGVKPFLGAGVGWQWTRFRFAGEDEQGIWGLTAGVEIPAGALTITPRVVYGDDFENSVNSSQQWTYSVEANYWLNAKTGVYASVGKTEVERSPVEAWNYEVGVRLKF